MLAPAFDPAQATMIRSLEAWLKREPLHAAGTGAGSIRLKIERNALQDLALLDSLDVKLGGDSARAEVKAMMRVRPLPPDWWLDFRRWLYRTAREH
jgi:hypothetical protein